MYPTEIKNISFYTNQEDYFHKLKNQLSKDFGSKNFDDELSIISIEFSVKLFELIYSYIEILFVEDRQFFYQLMYRIDIPDADMKSIMLGSGFDLESLTELILRRELLKILFREKYSG